MPAALVNARNIQSVSIIAHDRDFSDFGVGFAEEVENAGYNEAVEFALGRPEFADTTAILVLPGDNLLVTPSEIDALTAKQTEPTVRLASARDGDGTNGLMISPPKLIETTFESAVSCGIERSQRMPVRMSIQFKVRAFSISIRRKI